MANLSPNSNPDLDDPSWLPLRYVSSSDAFLFAHLNLGTISSATFLDERIGEIWHHMTAVPAAALQARMPASPAWLFHTAFCCSTLLARALHQPPRAVALKEPNILLDLAHPSFIETDKPGVRHQARLATAARLLARPWCADGRVLIKPTNAANRLLPYLLQATPRTRAILLHGSLEDFLLSCLKKMPDAEQPLRWMAQYLLPGSRLQQRLGIEPGQSFNVVEACVLVWHVQMEIYAEALATDTGDCLRSLSMRQLLDQPIAVVRAASAWLDLYIPEADEHASHVRQVFSRNSKYVGLDYDPERRADEAQALKAQHSELVQAALAWAERQVAPAARLPDTWKPLQIVD